MRCTDDSFRPREEDEKLIDPEVSYPCVIQPLMNLDNYTHHYTLISITLLARYNSSPTKDI